MSLVNDALQRAKQHTEQPVTVSRLELLPAAPVATKMPSFVRRFPIVITILVIVVIASVITGLVHRRQDRQAPQSSASMMVPVSKKTIAPVSESAPAPVIEELTAVESKVEVPSSPTNPPALVAVAPALRPVLPKLQAIFFNKSQPSAMINGKTLYVGSRLGEFRLAAITPTSATLVSGTETNILRFEE